MSVMGIFRQLTATGSHEGFSRADVFRQESDMAMLRQLRRAPTSVALGLLPVGRQSIRNRVGTRGGKRDNLPR
jgi:hypothetical protein